MKPLHLGATLYMPSLRSDLAEAGNGLKIPNLRTVVYCTEDSISESELGAALENLRN
ncbi:MAG: HpcH/HpaI aldolase/citrate lyase family protein, partial [Deltaproteobacteria bacterium]|nr:HpcH/HpaI aldolase/citrate lyase family protein [Deltaproteobacteria bacterium]